MLYSVNTILKPIAPYNFELNAQTFTVGDPQISRYDEGKFWQVIRVNKKLILTIIESTGTVDEPELLITLKSDEKITNKNLKSAENIIISIFNLNFDLKEFYEYMKNDPVMLKLIKKLKGLNSRTTQTVFESLASSIIEQQISFKAAQSIEMHMIKDHGDKLHLDDEVYYGFPTPQTLSKLTKEKLRESGLSIRKSEYIIDISKLIVDKKLDLEQLKEYKDVNKIIDELGQLRGVGEWTAHLTVLRSMHRHRAFPSGDLGLKRSISHFYYNGNTITSDEAREFAGKLGKCQGLAGFYLITAEIMGIQI